MLAQVLNTSVVSRILFCASAIFLAATLSTSAIAEHVIIDPNDPRTFGGSEWDSQIEASRVALEKKDFKTAYASASKALTLTSDPKQKALTYAMMSVISLARGKLDEALKNNDSALKIAKASMPEDIETRYNLLAFRAEVLFASGRREEGSKTISEAFALLNTKKDTVWTFADGKAPVHKRTGLICPLTLKGATLNDAGIFSLNGDDVACSYDPDSKNGTRITFYFSLRKNGMTMDQDFEATKKEIGSLYGGASPSSATQRTIAGAMVREAIYEISSDGKSAGSGLWISDVNGWSLKARITQLGSLDLGLARGLVDEFFASARKSAKNTTVSATE